MVINEYDRSKGFYKLFMAESKLRDLAERYSNAYLIGIFACCRQLYIEDKVKDSVIPKD